MRGGAGRRGRGRGRGGCGQHLNRSEQLTSFTQLCFVLY